MDLMRCSKCKEEKPLSSFTSSIQKRTYGSCIDCLENKKLPTKERHRIIAEKWRYRVKYGIILDDYNKLYELQNGKCAVCHNPELTNKKLSVDHNHKTGKIRGLLCSNCNHGIGKFQDDILLLENAITYLKYHNTD